MLGWVSCVESKGYADLVNKIDSPVLSALLRVSRGSRYGIPYNTRMNENTYPCPPAGVIFDMDGVICDTRDHHLKAFQELVGLYGLSLTAEEFNPLFGMANHKLIPKIFGEELTPAQIEDRADWKESRYRELIARDIELMAGVREMVTWLNERGVPVAVASSAPKANVEQILESTGLISLLKTYLGAEDVTNHKPHPEVFLTAAERMGTAPAETWVIEDSLHGINAGLAAGMSVLAVATTHDASELSPATAVFDDVAKVFVVLKTSE